MSRLGPQKISADQTTTPAVTVPTDVTLLDSYTEATAPTELGALSLVTDGDGGMRVGDGSTARRVYQIGDNVYGVINVMDPPYNAVADGVTDNSTAVQDAVDALPATGGTVYIPQDCVWTPASVTLGALDTIADHSGVGVAHYFTSTSIHYLPTGLFFGPTMHGWYSGTGDPEGVVTAPIGSLYTNTSGGASTTLYVKESGAGNTGWVAK
jgi:hypothetical protein